MERDFIVSKYAYSECVIAYLQGLGEGSLKHSIRWSLKISSVLPILKGEVEGQEDLIALVDLLKHQIGLSYLSKKTEQNEEFIFLSI